MQRWSGYVLVGGGLVILLGLLVASVICVSGSPKQLLVQPNSRHHPPPAALPTEAMSPAQLAAKTMAPSPPRHRQLHELFSHLFPNG